MLIEVNGHQLHITNEGKRHSPAVVLLHHGLGSAAAWRKQIPALVAAGFRVIAYDRWGYGRSEAREQIDMPAFTQDQADLSSLLDQLEVERAALVGHSDGGTIAMYFAAQKPERVGCLVTVAAHIYIEEKMQGGIAGVRKAFESDWRFKEGLRRAHGEKYDQVFRNWYFGWHRPESLTWNMGVMLAGIRCPALIVQGMDDEHASPKHARDIAEAISGAELWLVEGAAHMLPQEVPESFNMRLSQFLMQHMSVDLKM